VCVCDARLEELYCHQDCLNVAARLCVTYVNVYQT
jgi:hypothetical protein